MNESAREGNIAAVADLIGEPSRAAILVALFDKRALPASELAARAGISPQTASAHLARLVAGGLLVLLPQGRHRYYALASAEVAHALEALAVIAPPVPVRSLRQALAAEHLRLARTCYDHLAGKLGVSLTEALQERGVLRLEEQNHRYSVTEEGAHFLGQFDIELERLRASRRALALPCLDWSERRYHLAGALGTAFLERFFQLQWLEKRASGRAVRLTEQGQQGFARTFGESFCAFMQQTKRKEP